MLPRTTTPLYTPADIRQIAEHGEHTMDRRMAAALWDLLQRVEAHDRLLRRDIPAYDAGVTAGMKQALQLVTTRPYREHPAGCVCERHTNAYGVTEDYENARADVGR